MLLWRNSWVRTTFLFSIWPGSRRSKGDVCSLSSCVSLCALCLDGAGGPSPVPGAVEVMQGSLPSPNTPSSWPSCSGQMEKPTNQTEHDQLVNGAGAACLRGHLLHWVSLGMETDVTFCAPQIVSSVPDEFASLHCRRRGRCDYITGWPALQHAGDGGAGDMAPR